MTTYERPFGRSFEDFEIGDVYRHWPGKTITEYDDHLFCLLTMNHHPLHINEWFAEHETVQKKNVVVGNLVYSLVLGMSVPDVSGSCIASKRSRSSSARSTVTSCRLITTEFAPLAFRLVKVTTTRRSLPSIS